MKQELEKKLFESYPKLYANSHSQHSSMMYGFTCGSGWYDLINEMSSVLENLILAQPKNIQDSYRADQVKEKFGTLCVYMSSSTVEMDTIINSAVLKSSETCMECGGPGKLDSSQHWIMVLCHRCSEERLKRSDDETSI